MVVESALWTEKFAPQNEKEIVGNPSAVKQVKDYLTNFDMKSEKNKAIILIGPPGTGKTATVHVLAAKFDYDVLEINASDFRNEKILQRTVGTAAMKKSIKAKKGTVILVDEVDGISGREDRGGVGALIKIIKKTRNPIILTANDISDQKFSTLKRTVKAVKFKSIQKSTIQKVLQRICKEENIEYDEKILGQISENVKGDLRAAINDLQSVAQGKALISIDNLENLHQIRDEETSLFEALKIIFKEQDLKEIQKTLWQLDIPVRDFGLLIQRMDEIIPAHMEDPEELADAFDALSRADIVWNRIQTVKAEGIWKLFPYFSLELSAGVSFARKKTPFHFVNYYSKYPRFFFQNIGKLKRGVMASIGEKIRIKCHLSISNAIAEYLPYLSIIYQHNSELAGKLTKYFAFDKKEEHFLKNFWKGIK